METLVAIIRGGLKATTNLIGFVGRVIETIARIHRLVLAAIIVIVVKLVDYASDIFDDIVASTATAVSALAGMSEQGSIDVDVVRMVNTFFPLAETVVLIGALTALWVATTVVRVAKAWIPTMG